MIASQSTLIEEEELTLFLDTSYKQSASSRLHTSMTRQNEPRVVSLEPEVIWIEGTVSVAF